MAKQQGLEAAESTQIFADLISAAQNIFRNKLGFKISQSQQVNAIDSLLNYLEMTGSRNPNALGSIVYAYLPSKDLVEPRLLESQIVALNKIRSRLSPTMKLSVVEKLNEYIDVIEKSKNHDLKRVLPQLQSTKRQFYIRNGASLCLLHAINKVLSSVMPASWK
ncbi:MAG TPA: hypothetical protein DCS07_07145 [Bdellovibrionales bacterium]|nr:MAG: hypothetical protein A2Z97_01100 [Bdellovibrionales bacterium GWB1_52_6]OFZ03598.1 MAG: hypothetical protein A2X97_00700 [Bdellovibrionales bacterium GWA1_52_35]OFZ34947.1 MAG: hypothetical protein A2070_14525 [Bdellovibrionales bacterium GWC1_52_8]HAR42395.1 hypothetical protein [Bdellovibrionales bacterium]HCM38919.1 hypothetical protein [Bdellovibrionales bacterium]